MVKKCTGAQRTVHLLHNSEQPASVFSILDTGTKTIPLVADGLFDKLMQKMTSMYTSKKQTKIEAKGPRFEIGDFCVKLGSVTMSQNFKGVLVEFTQPRFGTSSSTTNESYLLITRSLASLATQSLVRLLARLSVWPNP
uniref:Mediator of RNA polymerase II transcription subunit 20 n=1 Tax=Timema tahoe TaxID=61484 RepID=A0A7R9NW32_9NEOP|nr:unnamed protein product [Timema tahoe]